MKQVFILLSGIAFSLNLNAQILLDDSKLFAQANESVIHSDTIRVNDNDTISLHLWHHNTEKLNDNDDNLFWGKDRHKKGKFDGHWEGIELGFNAFAKTDYRMYDPSDNDFMSLNQGKSMEFDFNFYELNIGLAKSYVGLVSGMGISFNNYRFENPYTIKKDMNRTEPILLDDSNLSKTKLAITYLNVPVLLEFQIPVNQHEGRLFINAGLVGGVKIGSHTKVKYGNNKEKDRSGFNLNSFKYAASARIGYKDVSLFANYSLTKLFESGKGPELTPFTIGISFLD